MKKSNPRKIKSSSRVKKNKKIKKRTHTNKPEANNEFLWFANKGPELLQTNYFESSLAKDGFCHLSQNAGAFRLLVPDFIKGQLLERDSSISEMMTGLEVQIFDELISGEMTVAMVFDDGSNTPYSLNVSQNILDFRIGSPRKGLKFLCYTKEGKVFEKPCKVTQRFE